MTGGSHKHWLLLTLIGPGLWAAGFASIYALHGMGCALEWNTQALGIVTLHRLAMIAVWLVTLAACLSALMRLPHGTDPTRRMPRIGARIGLGATIFTFAPLLIATSC